jgi:hypothetical protein
MQIKQVAQATAKVLQSYLTYQAVLTIRNELAETNPPQAIWLGQYAATHNLQDGEAFIEGLLADNKELVLRILTVREYLAEEVLDFLPGMVRSNLSQANVEHRRHLLERLTQAMPDPELLLPNEVERESDSQDSPPA